MQYLVLFNNLIVRQQVASLARIYLSTSPVFMRKFEDATARPYGYLVVDLKSGTFEQDRLCNSYTMGCPPLRGDNPRALASGLSYVQVVKHSMNI